MVGYNRSTSFRPLRSATTALAPGTHATARSASTWLELVASISAGSVTISGVVVVAVIGRFSMTALLIPLRFARIAGTANEEASLPDATGVTTLTQRYRRRGPDDTGHGRILGRIRPSSVG